MTNKVAIITGAGGDIGRSISAQLAKDGFAVLCLDIDEANNIQTVEKIVQAGHVAKALTCNILDETDLQNMRALALEMGQPTALVNNVGAITAASIQESTIENWQRDFDINLKGAVACFKTLEAEFKSVGGVVTNISSVNGFGVYGHPGYSAMKAALVHFTRFSAVEYGKFGMRINAVAPGTVRTKAWNERAEQNPQVFEEAKRWYPLQRVADPQDIANAVSFLNSDSASAITGVCLPVDCGLTAGQAELAGTFSQSSDF
ncbi:SDR family oxidoreductase [Maritalea sp.]|uniref:SDR family oxidoreductase n=1 Tax=Maritalea sp. TaxID=2003361 RepID=UPI003EF8CC61